jgi:hypothetical protein
MNFSPAIEKTEEKIMENTGHLANYLVLLKIRQKAYHRNLIIAGGLFFMTILLTTATLLFTDWNARSIWLMGIFVVLFTMGFLTAWARLEIIKENIELLNNLQQRDY